MPRPQAPPDSDWELRQRLTASLALRSQRSLERISQAPHWPRRYAAVTSNLAWVPADAQGSTKWRKATSARATGGSYPQLGDSFGSPRTVREKSREFWSLQSPFVQHQQQHDLLSAAEARVSPRPISGTDGWLAVDSSRRTPTAPPTPQPRVPSSPRPSQRLQPMVFATRPNAPPPGAQKPREVTGVSNKPSSSRISPRSVMALMRGESTAGAVAAWHTAPLRTGVVATIPQGEQGV